jgi:hypothetical protein
MRAEIVEIAFDCGIYDWQIQFLCRVAWSGVVHCAEGGGRRVNKPMQEDDDGCVRR